MLYCVVFGAIFIVFGLVFAAGGMLGAIPGWAGLPEEEKRGVRIVPLCRNIGAMIVLAGALLLLGGLWMEAGSVHVWMMMGWFALCVADLVFIRRSGRYVQSGAKGEG